MPQLTGNSETPAVGFHYGFADRQSHAGSVDLDALVSSAIELFEDEGLLEIVDAGTAIGNAGFVHAIYFRCGGLDLPQATK